MSDQHDTERLATELARLDAALARLASEFEAATAVARAFLAEIEAHHAR